MIYQYCLCDPLVDPNVYCALLGYSIGHQRAPHRPTPGQYQVAVFNWCHLFLSSSVSGWVSMVWPVSEWRTRWRKTSCCGGEDDGSGRGRGWVIEGDRCVCSLAPTLSSVAAVRLHDFHAAKNVPGVWAGGELSSRKWPSWHLNSDPCRDPWEEPGLGRMCPFPRETVTAQRELRILADTHTENTQRQYCGTVNSGTNTHTYKNTFSTSTHTHTHAAWELLQENIRNVPLVPSGVRGSLSHVCVCVNYIYIYYFYIQ